MTLEEMKTYLNIDGEEDDALVSSLLIAAKQYITNGTGHSFETNSELANLALKLLVSHWYERREPVGKVDYLAYSLQAILLQLRYCRGGEV